MMRLLPGLALLLIVGCQRTEQPKKAAAGDAPSEPVHAVVQKVDAPHLPNAYRLHRQVISGGLPEGDAAFAELAELGIKTIISVDGARPDVAGAARHGLRYVHLPHGYDGVPEERAAELAKAVHELPGPFYIHCHHGKHRSPAAATVACVGTGLLPPEDALTVLKTAGTSPNYRGLYDSATSARRIDDSVLEALQVEFRETVELPPMAESMVAIEHLHDHLKSMAEHDWKSPPKHPDLMPAHEALLLGEQFTELLRTDEAKASGPRFVELLSESEAEAQALEAALREQSAPRAGEAMAKVTSLCTDCHRQFRDVPLKEKQRSARRLP